MAEQPYATRDEFNYIGREGLARKDGLEKASGRGLFTRDVSIPGMLIAKTFISPIPHGKILSLDSSKAMALPGVRAIITYDNPAWASEKETAWWSFTSQFEHPLSQIARWEGQPMGFAIAADDERTVDRAIKLVDIEWEIRPFELDYEESARDKIILDPEIREDTNIMVDTTGRPRGQGDIDAGFAEADHIVSFTYQDEEDVWAGVEALSCTAVWRGEYLDVWVHNQIPLPSQLRIAGGTSNKSWANLHRYYDFNKINVHSLYQGAMFGGPNWNLGCTNYQLVPVYLARMTQRPVKHLYDGSHFYGRGNDEATHYVDVGYKDDGTITAVRSRDYGSKIDFDWKFG
ncbi:molybdopterin-dependent oxidoreductase [Candidatus Pacearchaeota archaeon]|nr:molybdopterin-dependent oxidoreductase [Candidatus Pacearchaeota archaeon]